MSFLCAGLNPGDDACRAKGTEELKRAAAEGHLGTEGWQARKNGSPFWANVITMAFLKTKMETYKALPESCAILVIVTKDTKS